MNRTSKKSLLQTLSELISAIYPLFHSHVCSDFSPAASGHPPRPRTSVWKLRQPESCRHVADFWLVGDTECVNLSIQLGIVRPGQAQIWWFLHVSKKSRLIHGCFYGPLQHTLASDILFPILLHDILDSVVLWLVARVCYSHNCNQLHLVTSFSSQLVGSNMFILNNQRTGRLMILHEHFV